jgi:hypothetical protein
MSWQELKGENKKPCELYKKEILELEEFFKIWAFDKYT